MVAPPSPITAYSPQSVILPSQIEVPMRIEKIAVAAAGLLLSNFAFAATHVACVGTTAELAGALAQLSTSTTDSDADEIRIRTGNYIAPAGGFTGSVTNHHDLTIRGGWLDIGCSQQTLDATATVLDGNHAAGVLAINTLLIPDSNIEVSGLTFRNGSAACTFSECAGGLKVSDSGPISGGNILVERNIFRDNSAGAGASAVGALIAATDGASLVVRGNLFIGNSAPDTAAVFLYSNNAIDVSNNTFSGNESTDANQNPRLIVDFFTLTGLNLANNVFWGNLLGSGAFDINLTGIPVSGQFKGVTLLDDDIESTTGSAVAESGTLHFDPVFAGVDDFRLAPTSPLIDAGSTDASGGLASVDLDGAPRVDAASVDIGAYESSYLFVGGFD